MFIISLHLCAFLCISLNLSAVLCISLNFTEFHCIFLHFSAYCFISAFLFISLHFSALLYISLHFSPFLCISLYFSAVLFISLHFSTFLSFSVFICISLHITFCIFGEFDGAYHPPMHAIFSHRKCNIYYTQISLRYCLAINYSTGRKESPVQLLCRQLPKQPQHVSIGPPASHSLAFIPDSTH